MLIREKTLFFKNRPSLRREANLNENGGILTLNALNVIYTRGYQKVLSLRHFPHSDSTMLHT